MRVHYSSMKQEKTLTDLRLLKKMYGKDYTKLSHRLSELRAANHLGEIPQVPPPRRHKLQGDHKNCWGIDYSPSDRIVLEPFGSYIMDDLSSIVEVRIVCLEDYH